MGRRGVEHIAGVEKQFMLNRVARVLLVSRLAELVPSGTGRIVMRQQEAIVARVGVPAPTIGFSSTPA